MRDERWEAAVLRLHRTAERLGVPVWRQDVPGKLIRLCDYVEERLPAPTRRTRVDNEDFGVYQTIGWEQAAARINAVMIRHGVTPPAPLTTTLPEAMEVIAGFIEELDIRLNPPPLPPEVA